MILQADACFICSCIVLQVLSLPEEEEEERGQCEAQQSGDIQHFSKVGIQVLRQHVFTLSAQIEVTRVCNWEGGKPGGKRFYGSNFPWEVMPHQWAVEGSIIGPYISVPFWRLGVHPLNNTFSWPL